MYRIVGADQKEYGPVSAEQIIQWIQERRANAQTLARSEDGPWKPLSAFPEFVAALGPSAPPPLAAPTPTLASAGATPKTTNGLAMTGLICSLLGIVCCGPILATLGLVFSGIALAQIHRQPLRYSGKGLAWAGVIIALADYIFFIILFATGVLDRVFRVLPRF